MQPLPPLRELRAFEAAARLLSFQKAAEELGVSPTAISHQIRLLEQFCGQPLFKRRPRPLTLTPVGERLLPVVSSGFMAMAAELAALRGDGAVAPLKITATNAFVARWIVPRLADWAARNPTIPLDILGTNSVLDLRSGEADVAVRYAHQPPAGAAVVELMHDRFQAVAAPGLIAGHKLPLTPVEIAAMPLIELEWKPRYPESPTWHRWEAEARARNPAAPIATRPLLRFQDELHIYEAIIGGHGIGLCSDVLVGADMISGAMVPVSDITLEGLGYFLVSRTGHPRQREIDLFARWLKAQADGGNPARK